MRRPASGHRFAYITKAEVLDNGAGTHLVDTLFNQKKTGRLASRVTTQRQELLNGVVDVVEHFAYLWESTRNDERWGEFGALHVGVLENASGRCRRIGADYMRSVIIESRNCVGRGRRTPRQFLLWLLVGEKKSPAIRLTLAQRKALKSRGKKTSGSSKHPTTPNAYRFGHWDQFKY